MGPLDYGASAWLVAEDRARQVGQQNLSGVLQGVQIKGALQKMQQDEQLRAVLAQAGGDPKKAMEALLASGTPQGIALAAHLKGLLPKPAEPYTLSPGAQRRGPNNELLAEAPKLANPQQPSNVSRLITERDALPAGHPSRAIYDQAITHATNPQQQRIIIPPQEPAPVAVIGPDGKPVLVNRRDAVGQTPAAGQAERAVPAPIAKAYVENNTALSKIDRAVNAVKDYPDAFGLKRVAGDTINQRVDPEGVTARAIVADIGSLKIHDRSGAAVTAAETPRLMPFIPRITDTPDTIKKKLASFKQEYDQIQGDISSIYSKEQGYKELPASKTPASPVKTIKRTGTYGGKKVIEYSDGSIEYQK